jgi:hypothetical protein
VTFAAAGVDSTNASAGAPPAPFVTTSHGIGGNGCSLYTCLIFARSADI